MLVFDRNLTGPERLAVMRYLAATYGIELPVRYRMVVLGDSIAAAQGVTPAESLIGRLLGYASTGLLDSTVWSGFSGAVGGTLTGDLIASNIHALDHFADGAVNLAVLWAGTKQQPDDGGGGAGGHGRGAGGSACPQWLHAADGHAADQRRKRCIPRAV